MKKISILRKKKGVSQSKLADILDVSLRTIQNYESGKVTVPTEKLNQIAKYFCVSVADLFNTNIEVKNEGAEKSAISTDEVLRLLELLFFHEQELKDNYPMYAKWAERKELTAFNDGAEAMKKKIEEGNK